MLLQDQMVGEVELGSFSDHLLLMRYKNIFFFFT